MEQAIKTKDLCDRCRYHFNAWCNIGCYITCAEWVRKDCGYVLADCKTTKVDGERIKEGVFYKLKNGDFVEADGNA